MRHVLHAVRREHEKLGSALSDEELAVPNDGAAW
jgi:hypothetical protein